MSLTKEVTQAVIERGSASVDDLMPLFPHLTRKQVIKAIQNCQHSGLLERESKVQREGRPRGEVIPARYRKATRPKVKRSYVRRYKSSGFAPRVAFVFHLGLDQSISVPTGGGTRYSKLGDW